MWPFDRLFNSQIVGLDEQKQSAAGPAIAAWSVGNPVARDRDYTYYSTEGFSENPVVNACVSMIAQAVATLPVVLKDGSKADKEITKHDVLDLLKRPSPGVSRTDLIEAIVSYYIINGNSYIEAVAPSTNRPPKELWALRSDRVEAIPNDQGDIYKYEYTVNGLKVLFERDPVRGKSNKLLHVKSFSPVEDFYGQSMLTPAAMEIDVYNEATKHIMALLQNGASPSGALIMAPIKQSDGNVVSAPAEVIERAEKSLRTRHSGSKNSGKPMVLSGNVDWKAFGFSPAELKFVELREGAARFICSTLDVPYQLVVKGESTYNNIREARLAFYTEAVLPLADKIYESLGQWLLPQFGLENAYFEIDRDKVEALAPLREMQQKSTQELYENNIIGRDEARERLQWETEPTIPQRKIDASILTSLNSLVEAESAPRIVVYYYMLSVGLLPKGTTFPQYEKLILDLENSEDDDEDDKDKTDET